MLRPVLALVSLALVSLVPGSAQAWLLHEHAATAQSALEQLSPADRARIGAMWAAARQKVPRLCASPEAVGGLAAPGGGEPCVSLPALTGLAADHSCSPADTRKTVESKFSRAVLLEAERVQRALQDAVQQRDRERQVDLWHLHHIQLQIADPDYVSRAEESGAHFQAARRSAEALSAYLQRVLASGQATHAIALYLNYHAAALALAHQAGVSCPYGEAGFGSCTEHGAEQLARALETEAFALHFLQDAFSAGHNTTHSGSRAKRMGTHDHYCEHGVAATTWQGQEYLAHGDAFLDAQQDQPRVAAALATSLSQLAAALSGPWTAPQPPEVLAARAQLDACKGLEVPAGLSPLIGSELARAIELSPRPATEPPGVVSFGKELGFFYSPVFGAALRVGAEDLAGSAREPFFSFSRLPIAAHMGLGLGVTFEGITDGSTDGVASLGLALLLDARPAGSRDGMRLGGALTWDIPFWIVPFDLLLAAPFVYGWDLLQGDHAYFRMALKAAAGGLLGWQLEHTFYQRYVFQLVAGREGLVALMPPPEDLSTDRPIFSFRGKPSYIKLALPLASLTTFHASSELVGLDLVWQLGYDLTYYLRDESFVLGAREGEVLHGIFLSFSFRSRRYFLPL